MGTYLLVDPTIPDLELFKTSVKVPYLVKTSFYSKDSIDSFIEETIKGKGYTNIGLAFENNGFQLRMFYNENLMKKGELFSHFISKIKSVGINTLDLITCDIYGDDVVSTISELSSTYGIIIRYSIDSTGSIGNWILESHSVDIKPIYFNSTIEGYNHILGSGGNHFGILLRTTRNLDNYVPKMFGINGQYQLGDRTNTNRTTPVDISGYSNVSYISCGGFHTVLKDNSTNNILAVGLNSSGQIGDGTTSNRTQPTSMTGVDTNINTISSGYRYNIFLNTVSGIVYCNGDNTYGQLGIGNTTQQNSIQQITDLSNISLISSGGQHTATYSNIGEFKMFGDNFYGQLGLGDTTQRNSPVKLPDISNVLAMSCGGTHTGVITTNGKVMMFGLNSSGQLGDGSFTNRHRAVTLATISGATCIATGGLHTAVVQSDGIVKTFGHNTFGQLGDGTTTTRGSPVTVSGITNAISVTCGAYSTLVLLNDGTVKGFGFNSNGQLGDGSTTNRSLPVFLRKTVGGEPIYGGGLLSDTPLSLKITPTSQSISSNIYSLLSGESINLTITAPNPKPEKYTLRYIKDSVEISNFDLSNTETIHSTSSLVQGTYEFILDGIYSYSVLDISSTTKSISDVIVNIEGGGEEPIPCFLAGTRILTPDGYREIQQLKDGDMILTPDRRNVPIMLKKINVPKTTEKNAPYCIPKNIFRGDIPKNDVHISPNHAIQIKPGVWIFPSMLKNIVNGKVKQIQIGKPITYYHIETPDYLTDNLIVDGLIAESYGRKYAKKVGYLYSEKVGGFVRVYKNNNRFEYIQ